MVATKDYYKTLGVDRKATPEQIKAAFRKQARKYHPDANKGDAEATRRFKELSEAYDVLGDPKKRGEYDNPVSQFRRGARGPGPRAGGPDAERQADLAQRRAREPGGQGDADPRQGHPRTRRRDRRRPPAPPPGDGAREAERGAAQALRAAPGAGLGDLRRAGLAELARA